MMEKFEVIKLLSEESRFYIFMKLLEFEGLCISELEGLLGLKQANLSKHMKKFKDLDIVEFSRSKNMIKYKIRDSFLSENIDLIKYLMM
jgi:ArsR family transcriptional regulator